MVAIPNSERLYPEEVEEWELDEELQEIEKLLNEAEQETEEVAEEIISELEEAEVTLSYKLADTCVTCNFRKYRLGRRVYCSEDEVLYPERLVCSRFTITENKRVYSHNNRLFLLAGFGEH